VLSMNKARRLTPLIIGSALIPLLAVTLAKADICYQNEDTVVLHRLYEGRPSTILQCQPMYPAASSPQNYTPAPKAAPSQAYLVPQRARRHWRRRAENLGDLFRSIFRPR